MKVVSILALVILLLVLAACGSDETNQPPSVKSTPRSTNTAVPPALAAAAIPPTGEIIAVLPTKVPRPTEIPPTNAPQEITAISTIALKIRNGPGTTYPQLGVLEPGTSVVLWGISQDRAWFQHTRGWSSAEYLTTEADVSGLPTVLTEAPPPPTNVPPTDVPPPTSIPPTNVPPTDVPPLTSIPPTEGLPTAVPPPTLAPTLVPEPIVPPPTPVVQAPPPPSNCDPNYTPCVPIASDVDCASGSGNGPAYVVGPVRVIGADIYDLDRDGNGIGCE